MLDADGYRSVKTHHTKSHHHAAWGRWEKSIPVHERTFPFGTIDFKPKRRRTKELFYLFVMIRSLLFFVNHILNSLALCRATRREKYGLAHKI